MPKRTVRKTKTKVISGKSQRKTQNLFSQIKLTESYVSLLLGALIVIIIALVGFSILKLNKAQKQNGQTSSTHTVLSVPPVISTTLSPSNSVSPTPTSTPTISMKSQNNKTLPEKYTVVTGDNLWSVSLKIYKSGYNWVDIAKANNISNPAVIFAGQQLLIPNVKPIILSSQATQGHSAITGTSYNVIKGDNLWEIAVRAYGDGYKWTDIARANNLTNPSLIFSGNILTIPR